MYQSTQHVSFLGRVSQQHTTVTNQQLHRIKLQSFKLLHRHCQYLVTKAYDQRSSSCTPAVAAHSHPPLLLRLLVQVPATYIMSMAGVLTISAI